MTEKEKKARRMESEAEEEVSFIGRRMGKLFPDRFDCW